MERIYGREESGFITTSDAADWTARAYLDAHPNLEHAATETLLDWPDAVVDSYSMRKLTATLNALWALQ